MSYILHNPQIIWGLLLTHLYMSVTSLAIAAVVALPVGRLIVHHGRVSTAVLGVFGTLYTVPSIALIILLLPIFGLNSTSVIVALVIYAQIILIQNVIAGLNAIDPSALEAARAMGMNDWQKWWRVELPLALPVILAGARVAAVAVIAIATIGAMFGAGGLGTLLFEGIAQARVDEIWAGAISVSVLAFAANGLLLWLEHEFDLQTHIQRASRQRVA
jgi:osmoprotectant transport system permease protein